MFDIDAFMNQQLQHGTSSSRQIKNQSGRAGRKQYQSRQTLKAVGGYANQINAIFAPPSREMCVVVPDTVGWNHNGTPRREPRTNI